MCTEQLLLPRPTNHVLPALATACFQTVFEGHQRLLTLYAELRPVWHSLVRRQLLQPNIWLRAVRRFPALSVIDAFYDFLLFLSGLIL